MPVAFLSETERARLSRFPDDIAPEVLSGYGDREQTRSDHLLQIQRYLGFRRASAADLRELGDWLLARALQHDRPTLLFQMACERLLWRPVGRIPEGP